MNRKFSGQLGMYMQQAGLPLRRIASLSGIPHQTIFNWLKGTQPRWHAALPGDLHRLGEALGLTGAEITLLVRLAGCSPARPVLLNDMEVPMEGSYRIPKGWFPTGDNPFTYEPEKYEMGVDPAVTYAGKPCVTIRAGANLNEFAALAQTIEASYYRGKRLRFSAMVRAADVENMAALFMRVSGAEGEIYAFDNMRNRKISGTLDWARCYIVLDVSEKAESIIYGFFLSQKGQVWMADVHLDEVGPGVPTTDTLTEIVPSFPSNLDFTE